jgi:hypothetical protein
VPGPANLFFAALSFAAIGPGGSVDAALTSPVFTGDTWIADE